MQNHSEVEKDQLIGNFFPLVTRNLNEFALFSQIFNIEKPNI